MKTSIRVANVPKADFERQVESDDPPTVIKLAQQGTEPRPEGRVIDLRRESPKLFAEDMLSTVVTTDLYSNVNSGAVVTEMIEALDCQGRWQPLADLRNREKRL
jgi:hypothetical protein